MKKTHIAVGLVAAAAFQLLALVGMFAKAVYPRWYGTEIHVETFPIDPRSMFRGNYVYLRYEFGVVPKDTLKGGENLRRGKVVYVNLKQADNGLHVFSGISLDRPDEGVYLRGRIVDNSDSYHVEYGIEALFAPKEKALELERELDDGGTAVLMVAGNGLASLQDVLSKTEQECTSFASSCQLN